MRLHSILSILFIAHTLTLNANATDIDDQYSQKKPNKFFQNKEVLNNRTTESVQPKQEEKRVEAATQKNEKTTSNNRFFRNKEILKQKESSEDTENRKEITATAAENDNKTDQNSKKLSGKPNKFFQNKELLKRKEKENKLVNKSKTEESPNKKIRKSSEYIVTISPAVSTFNITAYQSNYNSSDQKRSEAMWESNDIAMLSLNTQILFKKKLRIGVKYSNSVSSGSSSMIDTDWAGTYLGQGCSDGDKCYDSWTHRSWHDETTAVNMSSLDVNAYYNLFSPINIGVGFRNDNFRWKALNGTYIYSSYSAGTLTGYRDQSGTLTGKSVTYKQKTYIPYVGLELNHSFFNKRLSLFLRGAYSNFYNLTNDEEHNYEYYNYGGSVEFLVNKKRDISIGFESEIGNLEVSKKQAGSDSISQEYELYSFYLKHKFSFNF